MNLSEILETINAYARDYIRFVLSVVNRRAFREQAGEFDAKVVVFALISVAIGAFLFDRYARHTGLTQDEFVDTAARVFTTWMAITVMFHFGLTHLARQGVDFAETLSIVLRVMSVAYVLSAFAAAVIAVIARLFLGEGCAGWWGYAIMAVGEAGVIAYLMPAAVDHFFLTGPVAAAGALAAQGEAQPGAQAGAEAPAPQHHPGAARIAAMTGAVIALLLTIRAATIASQIVDTAVTQAAADVAKCSEADPRCAPRARGQHVRLVFRRVRGCFIIRA